MPRGFRRLKPLDGFTIENLTGTCSKGMTLANMTHVKLLNIKVQGFTGPLLQTSNVSGDGLEDAVPFTPAARPVRDIPAGG